MFPAIRGGRAQVTFFQNDEHYTAMGCRGLPLLFHVPTTSSPSTATRNRVHRGQDRGPSKMPRSSSSTRGSPRSGAPDEQAPPSPRSSTRGHVASSAAPLLGFAASRSRYADVTSAIRGIFFKAPCARSSWTCSPRRSRRAPLSFQVPPLRSKLDPAQARGSRAPCIRSVP